MWNISELENYLEREQIRDINAEQLEVCRYMCHVLNDTYDIELRNAVFTPGFAVTPVETVREGELCLISTKREGTEEELNRSVAGKSESLQANMRKSFSRGGKWFYDNPANKALSSILKTYGYLHTSVNGDTSYPEATAMQDITVEGLKKIFRKILDRYLTANVTVDRDELALKLIVKDPAFIHFAREESLDYPEFCLQVLKTNPQISTSHFSKGVMSSWIFFMKLLREEHEFDFPSMKFSFEIREKYKFAMSNPDEPTLLYTIADYEAKKEKLVRMLERLPKGSEFPL